MTSGQQGKPPTADGSVRRVLNESGIDIKPVYTAEDVAASAGIDASRPGEPPFTRGIHPLMYRKRPWTMRQYTGFANAADTNERFKYLIANGQTGLNVAFDLATQCGYDSDAPEAMGEVGRVGMAVDTLRDFEVAFDGIDLDAITVSLTINGAGELRKVGVNCYTEIGEEKPDVDLHPYDEIGARQQIVSLRNIRASRSNAAVDRALEMLRTDADAGRNVMPALMNAVKAYATVGEMTGVLVDVYGLFEEPTRLWRRAG